jgi:serine/threonine protein kinase
LNPFPERIGKYSMLRELGQGATARVLLGRDAFADRMVAVKLFHGGNEGGELTGMDRVAFLNEAKLVGKLNHPHIVALLDAAVEPDYAYVVMELVAGGTLAQYSAAERLLPVQKVIEVAFKISRALEYAYRHGVIHCDIKPSNVLVTDALDVKLSDFGIAIVKDATHTHLINAGTPAYVAPEQLSNDPPTQQSDIYSLGVLMYQLLTGRLPFSASSHAGLMYQILNHAPPTLRELRLDLPEAIEAIVLRAMQKDPGARYGSWYELGHELAQLAKIFEPPRDTLSEARRFQGLRGLPFFDGFSDVEIWETLRIARWRSLPEGTTIIAEGELNQSFYLLVEGEVNVTRTGRQLAILGLGDCFGEMLYFSPDRTLRTTSVQARSAVLIAEISATALSTSSDRCQVQFNKTFIRILINRLTAANKRLAER